MNKPLQPEETVSLHYTQPPASIPWNHVYFAFANGRFTYDCVSCGAKCCRGSGFNTLKGDLALQLKMRPFIRLFFEEVQHSNGSYRVKNCPPSCFFLSQDGLCNIHIQDGLDLKPETCRLFPFNQVRQVSDYLVVTPHPELCPLQIVSIDSQSESSDHTFLLREMRRHGIATELSKVIFRGSGVASLIRLERRIVSLSERYLTSTNETSYTPFAIEQSSVAIDILGVPSEDAFTHENAVGFLKLLRQVLGIAREIEGGHSPTVVQAMVAATPFLRAQLLFPTKRPVFVGVDRVPRLLLALFEIASLAHESGMERVTFQTLSRLFNDFYPLLLLLAFSDCEMEWKDNGVIDLSFPDASPQRAFQARFQRITKELLPRNRGTSRGSLGSILCKNLNHNEVDRIIFLKLLARRLFGKIGPKDPPSSFRWNGFRAPVQRWFIRNLSERGLEKLARVCHRKKNRAGYS